MRPGPTLRRAGWRGVEGMEAKAALVGGPVAREASAREGVAALARTQRTPRGLADGADVDAESEQHLLGAESQGVRLVGRRDRQVEFVLRGDERGQSRAMVIARERQAVAARRGQGRKL